MCGVIKKDVWYVVFQKKSLVGILPDKRHAPYYHAPVAILLSTVVILELFAVNV